MDRAVKTLAIGVALTALLLSIAPVAQSAIGPRHGGVLTFASPHTLPVFDPAAVDSHFAATVAHAVFDGLYEMRPNGRTEAVLADGPPEVHGLTATIRLRDGVLHHGGRPLRARHVVASLMRANTLPQASWLLGAFATENGQPAIREVDDRTIQIGLVRHGPRADVVLAARPLAIVALGNVRTRPVGTGPFRVRRHAGGVRLTIFRHAPDGAPWVNAIQFRAPQARTEEIRALELGQIDGSWQGQSVYGGRPRYRVATANATVVTPNLLIRNRRGALRSASQWGGFVSAIDRSRLERVGLVPRRSLGSGLPEPTLPSGRLAPRTTVRLIVRLERESENRLAGAIASMLEDHGSRLAVERLNRDDYARAVSTGRWDVRVVVVRPPLPGRGPLAGAAIAATGHVDRARALAPRLGDAEVAITAARELDAMVLGHERLRLHYRAALRGVALDGQGRLSLAAIHRARNMTAPLAARRAGANP